LLKLQQQNLHLAHRQNISKMFGVRKQSELDYHEVRK